MDGRIAPVLAGFIRGNGIYADNKGVLYVV